jgi:hypothetical protein
MIGAENAPRILKEICENMKAQAFLISGSIFFSYTCQQSCLKECLPATQAARVRFPTVTCLSRVTLFDDPRN